MEGSLVRTLVEEAVSRGKVVLAVSLPVAVPTQLTVDNLMETGDHRTISVLHKRLHASMRPSVTLAEAGSGRCTYAAERARLGG